MHLFLSEELMKLPTKKMDSFGFRVFVGYVIVGVGFCISGHGHPALGATPTNHFWIKFFFGFQSITEFLELLIAFNVCGYQTIT